MIHAEVVIRVELPTPDSITDVLEQIDPPNLKYFGNEVRISVGSDADALLVYLDEKNESGLN